MGNAETVTTLRIYRESSRLYVSKPKGDAPAGIKLGRFHLSDARPRAFKTNNVQRR